MILSFFVRCTPPSILFVVLLNASPAPGASKALRFGAPKTPSMGLVAVALSDALFQKQGVSVEVVWTESGIEANQLLFEHKLDLAAAYGTIIVSNHLNRRPQRIYSRLHFAKNNTALVVRKDRGIDEVKKIVGHRVGVPKGTNAHFFLQHFLESHLVGFEAIKVHFGDPKELVRLFTSGLLDAVAIWQPYLGALTSGSISTRIFNSDSYRENSLLIGRTDAPADFLPLVQKVLAALYQAQQMVKSNPNQYYSKVLTEMGQEDSPDMKQAWENQALEMSVTNLLVGQLNWQKDWYMAANPNFRGEFPSLLEDFVLGPLKKTSPYLVTIESGASE